MRHSLEDVLKSAACRFADGKQFTENGELELVAVLKELRKHRALHEAVELRVSKDNNGDWRELDSDEPVDLLFNLRKFMKGLNGVLYKAGRFDMVIHPLEVVAHMRNWGKTEGWGDEDGNILTPLPAQPQVPEMWGSW